MIDSDYKLVMAHINDIWRRLDNLEDNSPQGESGAVACSPAGEQVSLPRSPDRETIAKFKASCKDQLKIIEHLDLSGEYWRGRAELCKVFLYCLEALDRGDGHSSPAKAKAAKKARRVAPKSKK